MSGRRVEWRGDLFASDLPLVRQSLAAYPTLPRPFVHTVTAFLQPAGATDLQLRDVIRVRGYANLSTVCTESVATLLAEGLTGKLQRKAASGEMLSLGAAELRMRDAAVMLRRSGTGALYRVRSVRVSRRVHHTFASGGPAAERHRATLDLERSLFLLGPDGRLSALGQLGPRLEFKAPTRERADAMRHRIDPAGIAKRRPNRALELLFQDLLRERVTPAPSGFPETELKLDWCGELDSRTIESVLRTLGTARLLLPLPGRIERMRRYHVCRDPFSDDSCTVVETPSGRLSEKRKRSRETLGHVLLRDTQASRTTDRDGSDVGLGEFLLQRGWTRLNSFEKRQTKVPLALQNGNAYLVSFDHCFALTGSVLDQIELEFIGTTGGSAPAAATVASDLEELAQRLLAGPLGSRLSVSTGTKHAYFAVAAPASAPSSPA